MSRAATKLLMATAVLLAGGSLAFGQAGSTGGVIGKTDKSISGGESTVERQAPAKSRSRDQRPASRGDSDKSSGVSVAGRWRWSADCTVGHWQGEFDLSQTSRGNFSGSFAATSANDLGTISDGHVNGNRVTFTRTSSIATQYWRGRLTAGRLTGTSSGNANCSWQATRK